MFIKRNRSLRGDREYTSTLLVQGERVPAPRKAGRPPKDANPETVVVHRTLANLPQLPLVDERFGELSTVDHGSNW